ncbi:Asp-tRNA(Asn)/Glu-tRNA(Gln) amidotransferase subunit GatA [Lacibacter luteus]|uniref:Glutamyl-tRNA(Gln) amidotransferase subunit A n=1 Tax=Lacibacter luteus TaxID=2508719 RepID=A0A4Q1CFR6_9BACT|nr:Asp-tRNA(Asn)/Glu-tRNA(Gln) amidotransferase subunit GatA [Lacibacter luteus]RXK58512.1 Asp-tRNA(Asn)/Glu-tRNA(Gln) amidotransferase subunit GatA [Lacibacter luteus]
MYPFASIKAYQQQLFAGSTSCKEAVEFYLQQIEQQQQLNALVAVFPQEAKQQAELLDAKRKAGSATGKLHGVVLTVKDVIAWEQHPLSASSNILKGFHSIYNSTAVQKLLAEDAIIIGINNCDEFAMGSSNENSAFGPVRNKIDESRVPGGSSGGSAVAVQAHLCMVSLGSDTGGSVRQPADFCNIVGVKPTYGRVSRHGLIAYGSSFDQIGILANNVEDAALVLAVIAGADDYDATVSTLPVPSYSEELLSSSNKPVIGYFKQTLQHEGLDEEIRSSHFAFIEQLKQDGYEVKELEFDLIDYIVPTYYVLTTAEASSNLSRFDGVRYGYQATPVKEELTEFYSANRSEGFGKEVQRRIMLGTFVLSAGYYDAYYTKAQQVRRKLYEQTKLVFSEVDVLLMPVSPSTAFKIGEKNSNPVEMYLADIYTVFANLVGIPGLSIPLFQHSNGLPFGLQMMTKHFDEVSLLRLAHTFMQTYKAG